MSVRPRRAPRPGLRLRVPPSRPFLPGLAAAAGGGPAERRSPTPRSLLSRRILLSLRAAKVAGPARRLRGAHGRPGSEPLPRPRPPPNLGSRSRRTASSAGAGRKGATAGPRGCVEGSACAPARCDPAVCECAGVCAPVLMVPVSLSLRGGLAADRGRWRGSRMACPRGGIGVLGGMVHFSDCVCGFVCRGAVAGGDQGRASVEPGSRCAQRGGGGVGVGGLAPAS